MGLTFDTSDLNQMANRFEMEFSKGQFGRTAMERSLVRGVNVVKSSITKLQLVRTGNMRNSTLYIKPKENGLIITGEIITGSPVHGLSNIDTKTGKTITPSSPENYASHVEERFMFMRRVLGRLENILSKEFQAFVDAWSIQESSK